MDRLTEETQLGPFASLKDKAETRPGAFHDYDCLYAHMVAVTQLKAYEDTGLSPADIPVLTARAEAAEAERDACKADLQSIVTQSVKDMEKRNWTPPCRYCSKYFVCDYIPEESGCCFEWRGPQAGKGEAE